jgi:hypothetical protein
LDSQKLELSQVKKIFFCHLSEALYVGEMVGVMCGWSEVRRGGVRGTRGDEMNFMRMIEEEIVWIECHHEVDVTSLASMMSESETNISTDFVDGIDHPLSLEEVGSVH